MATRLATAEWADPSDIETNYSYREGSIWLGRSPTDNDAPLGYKDDRHVCLVSGNRGGKGTTSIVNSLLLWPGSVVVIDPKGENATITAARRGTGTSFDEGLGQAVHILDPFKAAQVDDSLRSQFNPLDALDPRSDECIDLAGQIADAIVIVRESNDPFWDESARDLIKGLLLHILTADEYEGRRNLVTLRNLVSRGDWETVKALKDIGQEQIPPAHGLLWTGVSRNQAFNGLISGVGDRYLDLNFNSPKLYESILQVATRNTEFIDSPGMQRCLSRSDFQLEALKRAEKGMSLFLCLPQRYMNTHHRWLRMMIALTVNEMEMIPGRPATGHQVLMMLDEFAGLKRMTVIENAVAQMAGYGLKLFFVLQSLEQLKAIYKDNWETFLANSGLKIFFNLEDQFSRDYVSKLIGETEIIRDVRSKSDSSGTSESLSHGTSTSRSENVSRSNSRSNSASEGKSWSAGTSESKGVNHSSGRSDGSSWTLTDRTLFRWYREEDNHTFSRGTSNSDGTSEGSSFSRTDGGSRGSSSSMSDGTSYTHGSSTGENVGKTTGNSLSKTTGQSETIQRRPLIFPDEIGQAFASVTDRNQIVYPGLGLVLIAGQRPLFLRRVNYYEDVQFIGLFTPHPDHHFIQTRVFDVGPGALACLKPDIAGVTFGSGVTSGSLIRAGDVLVIAYSGGKAVAEITFPLPGKVMRDAHSMRVLHYGDGALDFVPGEPFKQLKGYCEEVRSLEKEKKPKRIDSETRFENIWPVPEKASPLISGPQDNLLLRHLMIPPSQTENLFTPPSSWTEPTREDRAKRRPRVTEGWLDKMVGKICDLFRL